MARPATRPGDIAVVGASLGANLAAVAASDLLDVRAIALVSPSLDYRGIRLDAAVMKRIGARPLWLAASTQDPYALRTLKELVASDSSTALRGGAGAASGAREQRLSNAAAHGTNLLAADGELTGALLDWLKRQLIF
jgi:acetyl esterase/lipase